MIKIQEEIQRSNVVMVDGMPVSTPYMSIAETSCY